MINKKANHTNEDNNWDNGTKNILDGEGIKIIIIVDFVMFENMHYLEYDNDNGAYRLFHLTLSNTNQKKNV